MRVYLLGYMGSGKSRFGRMISQATGWEFLDLDEVFETRFKISIPDFFLKYDEPAFRMIERSLLLETIGKENIIVSTGGGTPCFFDNMEVILKNGYSIYLRWEPADLKTNILKSRKVRPLLQSVPESNLEKYIIEHLQRREPFYQRAELIMPLCKANVESQFEVLIQIIAGRTNREANSV